MSPPAARSPGCRRRRSCSIGRGSSDRSTSIWPRTHGWCWRRRSCSDAPAWGRWCSTVFYSIAGACAGAGGSCTPKPYGSIGAVASRLAQPAVAKGGIAVATVLVVPGDEGTAAGVRALGDRFRGEVGVSAWNGLAAVRLCAADGEALRHDLVAVLAAVRGAPLPRLWLN